MSNRIASTSGTPAADPRDLLYVSDLDGTLLAPDGSLSADAIRRLNRLIDRGLRFTIATARNYDSAYPILRGLNLKLPAILFNGVYLTDFQSGENVLYSNFISREIVEEVISFVTPLGIDPFIYTYGAKHRVYYRGASNPGAQAYIVSLNGDRRLHHSPGFEFEVTDQITGFLLIDTHTALAPVHRELHERFSDTLNIYFARDISNKDYHWLQSYHQEASKGRMLKLLTEHLNVPLSHTVVFGDYLNDLDMFQAAGKAIAVENALPELKQVAHQVIGHHENNAVIDYLESLGF